MATHPPGANRRVPSSRTVRDYPTDYWNDSCAAAELSWAIEHGAHRRDHQPDHRGRRAQEGDGHLGAADPGDPGGATRGHRPGGDVAGHRGDGHPWLEDARTRVRAGARPQGTTVDPDQPHVPRVDRADARPGATFRHPRSQRPGQVPGDRRGSRGHRAGDLRGHLHQCHGQLHGVPGTRGRRGGGAGAPASRGRGSGRVAHVARCARS